MAYIAVNYVYDQTRPEEIAELRPKHRAFLRDLADQGINIASGPLSGEVPGALLIMNAESVDSAVTILDEDPFWKQEFIVERTAREWDPVIGVFAEAK